MQNNEENIDLIEELDGLTISEAIKFLADFPFEAKIEKTYHGDNYHGDFCLEIIFNKNEK